jgi:hypothetical protein
MNERPALIRFRECMNRSDGWGRARGREAYQRLLTSVERLPRTVVFRVSFADVERLDTSFASETVVEIARRFRKEKGFCIVDLTDEDIIENVDLAASKKDQPIFVWSDGKARLIGRQPSQGVRDALDFALARDEVRSVDYAEAREDMSVSNASMKFKALWIEGFLLRRESTAESGGVEHVYSRIA